MIESLWVEKYRPKTIDDCILNATTKQQFLDIVEKGNIQHLLLSGSPGTGKTSVALALCNELNAVSLMINASLEGKIDVLRNKIQNFASTVSLDGRQKIVILDECDYTSGGGFQPALRGFLEKFSEECRFIMTCNFRNRIIDPIQSRCTVIEFAPNAEEKETLMAQSFIRLREILEKEKIEYEPKVVAELVKRFYPDLRRLLNELQKYSVSGKIDSGIMASMSDAKIDDLLKWLKDKNFTAVRKWVAENNDMDSSILFSTLYNQAYGIFRPESIPQVILILAEAQYRDAFVADKEINVMAALVEIMSECIFKDG